jgi:hypothetical protein
MGNYESEAALVQPGVRRERARRKGSNNDWGAPGSTAPVRACEQEPERERERRDERRGASATSRSGQVVSHSPLFICEVHENNSVRERGADISGSAGPRSRVRSDRHREESITLTEKNPCKHTGKSLVGDINLSLSTCQPLPSIPK